MRRPEGETRRERRLLRIVFAGVVAGFFLLSVIVIMTVANYKSQTNHHASTAKQQNTIIAQNKVIEHQNEIIRADTNALVQYHAQTVAILNQISALQNEFTQSVGQIPAISASLTAGQNALLSKLADADARIDKLCAVLPSTVCATP